MKTTTKSAQIPMPALMLMASIAMLSDAFAGSATWNGSIGDGNWYTSENWTPQTVPNGLNDTATFGPGSASARVPGYGDGIILDGIVFNTDGYINASDYGYVGLYGFGVANNSGGTPSFDFSFDGNCSFYNFASAGASVRYYMDLGGRIDFNDNSTAGGSLFVVYYSSVSFLDHSSATKASFVLAYGGYVYVGPGASAGSAIFTMYGRDTDYDNDGIGAVRIDGNAAGAHFTVYPGDMAGGVLIFAGASTGGTSSVRLDGHYGDQRDGRLDISSHGSPGVTIGSLAGDGSVFLGAGNLTIGSNNLSTAFFGTIQDGGIYGGTGGSLTKIGTGKLVLGHRNSYTGGTTVNGGKLVVNNLKGSGTGSGPVRVISGRLGGSGIIAGDVTVGDGSGREAVLSPGRGAYRYGTLTIQSTLSFGSDATYNFTLNTNKIDADKVVALGVTIKSGAHFSFFDVGGGVLTPGTILTVINNTAVTPIAGTFSNLPNGATFTSNGNSFKANYQGGDGNDLILTVLP